MSQHIVFRLPIHGWPRAIFESDYGYRRGRLLVEGDTLVDIEDRDDLERGVRGKLRGGEPFALQLTERDGASHLQLRAAGRAALRESELSAPASRSAWIHALIALAGSFAGFVAGWMYLVKAQHIESAWAMKMAYHTAGWHLLLTFLLFPLSVWGQRPGIRSVQVVSSIFFCIHVGIALANWSNPDSMHDGAIAILNAFSGVLFLASVVYGQVAYRDMDPVAALPDLRS